MAFDVTAIRKGLEARVETTGLRTYPTIPEKPEPPCAVVAPDDPFIDYHETMSRSGVAVIHFAITLLVARARAERGQDVIDGYLSSGMNGSLVDALEAVDTGNVSLIDGLDSAVVTGATSPGFANINGIEFQMVRVNVTGRGRRG